MEDAVHALMMAFAVIVFVIAFTISMYDNIDFESGKDKTTRIVDANTIIPTLYRYANEDFCVRIYADSKNPDSNGRACINSNI